MFNRKFLCAAICCGFLLPNASSMEKSNKSFLEEGKFKDLTYYQKNLEGDNEFFVNQECMFDLLKCMSIVQNSRKRRLASNLDRMISYLCSKYLKYHLISWAKNGHSYFCIGDLTSNNTCLDLLAFAFDHKESEVVSNDIFDELFEKYPNLKKISIPNVEECHILNGADIASISSNNNFKVSFYKKELLLIKGEFLDYIIISKK